MSVRNYWKHTITAINSEIVIVARPRGLFGYIKYLWDKKNGWECVEHYSFFKGYFIYQKFRAGTNEIPWQIHFSNELIFVSGMLAPALVPNQPEDSIFFFYLKDPTKEEPFRGFGEFKKHPQIKKLKDEADRLYDKAKKMAESAIKNTPL